MIPLFLNEIRDTPSGELVGRHYRNGEAVRLCWSDHTLTSIERATALPAGAPWIAPALVDVQVNGYAGIDFQQDSVGEAELLQAARGLRRDGCPRFLLTLITREWNAHLGQLARLKAIRDANPELRQAIFGWHIEGPFISGEPGFIGAHDPEVACNPTPQAIEELKATVGDDPLLLTLAPERPGSVEAITRARQLGIVISAGHTNASRAQLDAAADAGLAAFTHLGNGCPQQLDRHNNILWRVLDQNRLIAGIIPDTHHVTPPVFRLFHRLLPADQIYWTTDAMTGAGAPPGCYTMGRLMIEVGEDRIARQPGMQNFAGSTVDPLSAIRNGATMLGKRWNDVWDFFSVNPARLMGRSHGLEIGSEAVFCLLSEETPRA